MRKVDIVNVETGEILGTVTTRYDSIEILLNNISRWSRRHPGYRYVSADELNSLGIKWSEEIYWVAKIK